MPETYPDRLSKAKMSRGRKLTIGASVIAGAGGGAYLANLKETDANKNAQDSRAKYERILKFENARMLPGDDIITIPFRELSSSQAEDLDIEINVDQQAYQGTSSLVGHIDNETLDTSVTLPARSAVISAIHEQASSSKDVNYATYAAFVLVFGLVGGAAGAMVTDPYTRKHEE